MNLKPILLLSCLPLLAGCLMTRSQVREKEKQSQVTQQLQESKAQTSAQLVEVDETIRTLNGRIEELEASVTQLKVQNQTIDEERNKERQNFENKLKVYQDSLSQLELQYQALAAKVEEQARANSKPVKKVAPPKKKGIFEKGESFFNEKKWKLAIVEFDKYRTRYPKGRRYTNATYYIGRCFEELKMKDQAKVFYNELVDRYPKTKMAGNARSRLKKIK